MLIVTALITADCDGEGRAAHLTVSCTGGMGTSFLTPSLSSTMPFTLPSQRKVTYRYIPFHTVEYHYIRYMPFTLPTQRKA